MLSAIPCHSARRRPACVAAPLDQASSRSARQRRAASLHRSMLQGIALSVLTACASVGRASIPEGSRGAEPARRLVLALDGIDYRDIVEARAEGLFAQFRPPSRLISTFPSISDISWHDILDVQPPKGYQRIYYSAAYNDVIGGPLDAIRPIEFEERMDMAFGTKFHHLSAYIASNRVARREVDVAIRDFFKYRGQPTVYVYNVGPDALQHTRGDLVGYLRHLDEKLTALQERYRQLTGRALEIVMLSDHGHNRGVDAQFLPVIKALEAHGFHDRRSLRTGNDVAFSVDGVTTGFGVFVHDSSVARLARVLVAVPGVDMVTYLVNDSAAIILRDSSVARVERRSAPGGDRYRYVTTNGDPLLYAPRLSQMRLAGALDHDGFADAADWVRYTADARYPVAVVRIMRGHTVVTLNPAPILVSLSDGYRVGLGMVSVANKMRPLGGTHGALSETNSQGVLMTTFLDTHDDLTNTVKEQLGGFDDLGAIHYHAAGARLTNSALTATDRRNPFHAAVAMDSTVRTALDVWLTPKDRDWLGSTGALFVELHEVRPAAEGDTLVGSSYLALPPSPDAAIMRAGEWLIAPGQLRFQMPLTALHADTLRPSAPYEIRVRIDRIDRGPQTSVASTRTIARLSLRTTAGGDLWPY